MSSDKASVSLDTLVILFLSGWGIILFLTFVKSVYSCIRRFRGDDGGRIGEGETPERYITMSPARQEEIDKLRENALHRYMSKFTLTLGDEHLLCCSGSQTDSILSTSTNEATDINNDIEKGKSDVVLLSNGGDMALDSESTAAGVDVAATAIEYTHISIPMPGCEMTGINNTCSIEKAKESRQEGNRWKILSLFQSGNDEEIEKSQTQTEPCDKPDTNSQLQPVEKRSVPIFCAICLSEFEKGDRVCWSSNANCSHVFHEDCILQWLISSGKKIAMSQYFTKHPTDAKLLENEFCPCCRQEFICVKPPSLLGSDERV